MSCQDYYTYRILKSVTIHGDITTFDSSPTTLELQLKEKRVKDTSFPENLIETNSLLTLFHTASHAFVDDN